MPSVGGSLNFNQNATGDSVAALLYGWVSGGSRQETILIRNRANLMGMYLQDDWKVSPKLKLNLELRWDLDTPRFEAIDNRQNSFEVDGTNPVCNCPSLITWSGRDATRGSRYAHNFVYDNIEPSVGLSYRATDDCPGWRIIVYTEQYDQATPIVTNTGFAITGSLGILFRTDAAYRLRDGLPPVITPIEADLVPGFGVAFGTSALNQILGGWTIGTIIEARTGPLFSVY